MTFALELYKIAEEAKAKIEKEKQEQLKIKREQFKQNILPLVLESIKHEAQETAKNGYFGFSYDLEDIFDDNCMDLLTIELDNLGLTSDIKCDCYKSPTERHRISISWTNFMRK